MTEAQLKQIETKLPEGQTFKRAYRAIEGDIRAIGQDAKGKEYRYRVIFNADDTIDIKRF